MPGNKKHKKQAKFSASERPLKVIKLFWIFVAVVMIVSLLGSLVYMIFYV